MLKKIDRVAVILNYSNYKDTMKTANNLLVYKSIDHVVIVDNSSPNNSFIKLKKKFDGKAHVIKTPQNKGYAYGNNFGIQYAISKWSKDIILFIVNPDVLVKDHVIDSTAQYIEINKEKGLGQVAPKSSNELNGGAWKFTSISKTLILDGFLGFFIRTLKRKYSLYKTENQGTEISVDVLSGAFFGIYGETFARVNFFDDHTFLYGEEQILALKLKKLNLKNIQLQYIQYDHVGGTSTSTNDNLSRFTEFSKSRRYLIKEYLNANRLELFLFDLNYIMSYFARKLFRIFT